MTSTLPDVRRPPQVPATLALRLEYPSLIESASSLLLLQIRFCDVQIASRSRPCGQRLLHKSTMLLQFDKQIPLRWVKLETHRFTWSVCSDGQGNCSTSKNAYYNAYPVVVLKDHRCRGSGRNGYIVRTNSSCPHDADIFHTHAVSLILDDFEYCEGSESSPDVVPLHLAEWSPNCRDHKKRAPCE